MNLRNLSPTISGCLRKVSRDASKLVYHLIAHYIGLSTIIRNFTTNLKKNLSPTISGCLQDCRIRRKQFLQILIAHYIGLSTIIIIKSFLIHIILSPTISGCLRNDSVLLLFPICGSYRPLYRAVYFKSIVKRELLTPYRPLYRAVYNNI